MKILNTKDYESELLEGRNSVGAKLGNSTEVIDPDKPAGENETIASIGKTVVKLDNYDDFEGKRADKNPSHGMFSVDAPLEYSKKLFTDKKVWNDNLEDLFDAIKGKSDFFVQGEAGWAKTALVTQMANTCGYTVITVYLDKAVPEDLDGLPAVREDKNRQSGIVQVRALPVWAQYMLDRPNEKFLLFFDEMNQATSDVMHSLMPIVLKHVIGGIEFDNYFCGGAGNMSYEDNTLESIPKALMSRMGGAPITWITGTPEAWKEAFEYLHGEWDNQISKEVVSAFERHATIFASPRDIEKNIFKNVATIKNSFDEDDEFNERDRVSVGSLERRIKRQTNTIEGRQYNIGEGNEYTDTIASQVRELAEKCYDFINGSSSGRKFNEEPEPQADENAPTFDKDEIKSIIDLIVFGEMSVSEDDPDTMAPITHETIFDFFPSMNKELLNFIDKQMAKEGKEWMYPHNEDAVKTGKWTLDELE